MSKKIAKIDNDAMNSLFASEIEHLSGTKTAAVDVKDQNGAPEAPQSPTSDLGSILRDPNVSGPNTMAAPSNAASYNFRN